MPRRWAPPRCTPSVVFHVWRPIQRSSKVSGQGRDAQKKWFSPLASAATQDGRFWGSPFGRAADRPSVVVPTPGAGLADAPSVGTATVHAKCSISRLEAHSEILQSVRARPRRTEKMVFSLGERCNAGRALLGISLRAGRRPTLCGGALFAIYTRFYATANTPIWQCRRRCAGVQGQRRSRS